MANGPSSRRVFLTSSGAIAAAVAVPAAAQPAARGRVLDLPLLEAVAAAVLPEEIGAEGVREALRDFVRWLDGFRPVAELTHPYLSSDEVRYGPADPAPMWNAQLEALDLLAKRRHQRGFRELPVALRREVLATELDRLAPRGDLPAPAAAAHVAVGLLAHYAGRPATADLAYGARIGAQGCRDLPSGAERPPPLEQLR